MIVDFAIPAARLIIELDGGIHDWSGVALKDEERDLALKASGWKVIRIKNQDASDGDALFRIISEILGI